MKSRRTERMGELIHQAITDLLESKIKDPRIGFATIMDVEVSPDMLNVNVRVSVMGSEKEKRDTFVGLEQASGFLRREIAKRVQCRKVPTLRFYKDETLDYQERIHHLLDEIAQQQETKPHE